MTTTPILYTNPMSRGRIVRWMLEEVGVPYETVVLPYGPSMKTPDFLALNPMGKVPTLVHNEMVITEAAAICAYLADAFPDAGFAPSLENRGAYYRWLFFAAGSLENAVTNRSLGFEIPEEKRGMVGYGSFDLVMDTLEGAVTQQPFLTGERISAADIYLGSHIGWGLQFKSIEPRPAFYAYWDRLSKRPAYERATGLDDAAIGGYTRSS